MLPRVNVVVPTDAFYELSVDEARDLNEDGNGDPIMGEFFERGRGPDDDSATFRIRSYAADGVTPVYNYYIAEYLWNWASRGARTDPLRRPWRYSDWMALRNQFAPNLPVPNWVAELEDADFRVVHNGGTQTEYWNDNHDPPLLVRTEYENGMTKHWSWNGTAQRRFLNKVTYNAPYDMHFRGSTKQYVFYDQPDPSKQNYHSDGNWSRLVSHNNPDKWQRFYSGPGGGDERLRLETFPTGESWSYKSKVGDAPGDEHLTKIEFGPPSRLEGQTWFYYGGESGWERKGRVEYGDSGQVDRYEGQRGRERKKETQFRDANGDTVSIFFKNVGGVDRVSKVVAWGKYHTPIGSAKARMRVDSDDSDMGD